VQEKYIMEKLQEYLALAGLQEKEHQKKGIKWLLSKEKEGSIFNEKKIYGGFLADEMGLGKTIQMTALMYINNVKTLIVLPRNLVEQWRDFILKSGNFKLLVYHGNKRERDINIINTFDIVITTYHLLKGNEKENDTPLHKIKWGRVVFDEAHHLRNKNTKLFKGAKNIKSEIRWIVTGTPIQNSKNDFYSLCDQIGIDNKFYTNPANLHKIVLDCILKRTKDELNIILPDLYIENLKVDWETNEEKTLAREIHSLLSFSKLNISEKNLGSRFGMTTLPLLMRAKQCCVYPALLKEKVINIIKDENREEYKKELENNLLKGAEGQSKLNAVINKIIERSINNNKKIIFCNFKEEIDKFEEILTDYGFNVKKLDGRTKQIEREDILNNKDIDILILQIQTGCEGLNLQHFNEIYFVSPHWNPAIEDQAIARAHRIGQQKEIYVFKFLMDSFDEDNKSNNIENHAKNIQDDKRRIMKMIEEDQMEIY